jgi:hypothetical protein
MPYFRFWHEPAEDWKAEQSALPLFSDFDLLGNRKSVVDLDPEIANRAINLRVSAAEPSKSSRLAEP